MAAAQRADFEGRVSCPAAEDVIPIGIECGNGCVPVEPSLNSDFEGMILPNINQVLLNLEKVSKGAQNCPGRSIERFIEAVGEFQRGLRLI